LIFEISVAAPVALSWLRESIVADAAGVATENSKSDDETKAKTGDAGPVIP
jgi:hypothetical protein